MTNHPLGTSRLRYKSNRRRWIAVVYKLLRRLCRILALRTSTKYPPVCLFGMERILEAIRSSISTPRGRQGTSYTNVSHIPSNTLGILFQSLNEVKELLALIREAILDSNEPWRLEILDGGHPVIDNLIIKSGKIPSIRSISSSQEIELKTLASLVPTVRFVDIQFDRKNSAVVLKLSQLTSLSIIMPDVTPLLSCSFPSLKHLSISMDSMTMEDFQQLLTVMGENLVTLLDDSFPSHGPLAPNEVWSRCPKLQRFQTTFDWPVDASIPESLHTLQIPLDRTSYQSSSIPSIIPIHGLQSVSSTVLSFNRYWRPAMEYNRSSAMSYVIRAMELDIPFHDLRGVRFQDFIVRLLQHRKAGIRKPVPGWDTEARYF
jgi:hypothetical protein